MPDPNKAGWNQRFALERLKKTNDIGPTAEDCLGNVLAMLFS